MILSREQAGNYKKCLNDCRECDLTTEQCKETEKYREADLIETLEAAWTELDKYKKEEEKIRKDYICKKYNGEV